MFINLYSHNTTHYIMNIHGHDLDLEVSDLKTVKINPLENIAAARVGFLRHMHAHTQIFERSQLQNQSNYTYMYVLYMTLLYSWVWSKWTTNYGYSLNGPTVAETQTSVTMQGIWDLDQPLFYTSHGMITILTPGGEGIKGKVHVW